MSPTTLARSEPTPSQSQVELNPTQEALFRALNENFGPNGWAVNRDMRFVSQVGCHPIDIIAPLEQQAAILPRVLKLQASLSKKFDIQVYFIITTPD